MPRLLDPVRAAAGAAGRDRLFFAGSDDLIRGDIARPRALDTTELISELDLGPPIAERLASMERLRRLVD